MTIAHDHTRSKLSALRYSRSACLREAAGMLSAVSGCASLQDARTSLLEWVNNMLGRRFDGAGPGFSHDLVRARDCARAATSVFQARSEEKAEFSVAKALWDLAAGRERSDLKPSFFAEIIHLVRGLEGRSSPELAAGARADADLTGREAAMVRSAELDRLWETFSEKMSRYPDGLAASARKRREQSKRRVMEVLGATEQQWGDWNWQVQNLIVDAEVLGRVVSLDDDERDAIRLACEEKLPFAVTPYYASLMDEDGCDDFAIRAQVIPPMGYVQHMSANRGDLRQRCDFMLEADTSPVDLVTRRYAGIVIVKPFNTCPQICVYCQRNWEIEQAMAPGALADEKAIDAAIGWIREHPAVQEVLITGGDPLGMSDERLESIIERIARVDHVDLIRIGTRTPVTIPMRITEELAAMLGNFRELGRRDVAVVTHVEHPYEITMDMALAIDRLKRAGISVYNQQVYTFYVSRRFESARLRVLLRRIGVDPYYMFAPKGKEETAAYQVPLARIFQERKEESRLLPGLRRTDEPVYNLPGLGKNNLRATQHRDLLSVLPDGSRVYEFHPWEKNIIRCDSRLATDVPILDYLRRLEQIGEDPDEYRSIWYYF